MPNPPYNLLIATGQTPQVITETIFELNRSKQRQPAAVHVATTRVGRAYGEAQLLGKERTDPARGIPIEGAEERWSTFCHDELGRDGTVDLTFHVPEVEGQGLDDIRRRGDDTRFGNLCYRLVERLTREDQLPLVGSIAGGRKTMSAHLMTAFSVYARPDDQLTHILVSDPELEGTPSFFYPEAGTSGYGQLLDLVNVRFPRVHTVLRSDVLADLPEDRRNLEGILDALEPHVNSARTVSSVRLELRDQDARLVFEGGDRTIDTCPLSAEKATTLLVFAEQRAAAGNPVPLPTFVNNDEIERQRDAVRWHFAKDASFAPWTETLNTSQAVSRLNTALRAVPIAERLLQIEGVSSNPRRYDWPAEAPPLRVATQHASEDWPFDHVPAPTSLS